MIRSLIRLINSFSKKLNADNVSAFSAQAAFFLIISFFPFFMFLLTLLNYLPFSKPELLSAIESVFPQTVAVYLSDILDELLEKSNGTVLSLTAIATLWTSSKGFYALHTAFCRAYHRRPLYFRFRQPDIFVELAACSDSLGDGTAYYQCAHSCRLLPDDFIFYTRLYHDAEPQILLFCRAARSHPSLGGLDWLFLSFFVLH